MGNPYTGQQDNQQHLRDFGIQVSLDKCHMQQGQPPSQPQVFGTTAWPSFQPQTHMAEDIFHIKVHRFLSR